MTQHTRIAAALSGEVVTFLLGNEVLAVATARVREILEPGEITRVPGADEFVASLVNVRGAVVPLADLRVPLRMPREDSGTAQRVLVLELPLAGQDCVVGILADSVYEVTRIEPEQMEAIPVVGTRWPPRYVSAVGRWHDGFVTIPDLNTIFAEFLLGTQAGHDQSGRAGRHIESEASSCA